MRRAADLLQHRPHAARGHALTSLFGAAAAADVYESRLVELVFLPFARDLVRRADPAADDHVVDLACGTGAVTRVLAEQGVRVTGIDLTPAMLDVARALVPTATLQVGDLTALPLDDACADIALCQQGLQFVPDQPAAVREMLRILRPGGRFLVSCWQDVEHSPLFAGFRDGLQAVGWTDLEPLFATPFSLGADRLSELLDVAGFGDVDVQSVELHLPVPDPRDVAEQYASVPPFALRWTDAPADERRRYLDAATAGIAPGAQVPFRTTVASGRVS